MGKKDRGKWVKFTIYSYYSVVLVWLGSLELLSMMGKCTFLGRQEKYQKKAAQEALSVALPRAKDALLRISRRALTGCGVKYPTVASENVPIF